MSTEKIKYFVFFILFYTPYALSHLTGHGEYFKELGPSGGRLVSIVRARDSELGAQAQTQAIAEWKLKDKSIIDVVIWDKSRKKNIETNALSKVKWILLGEKLHKPVVIESEWKEKTKNFSYVFDSQILSKVEKIEIILPSLAQSNEKHVFLFDLSE